MDPAAKPTFSERPRRREARGGCDGSRGDKPVYVDGAGAGSVLQAFPVSGYIYGSNLGGTFEQEWFVRKSIWMFGRSRSTEWRGFRRSYGPILPLRHGGQPRFRRSDATRGAPCRGPSLSP